jgi:hypothetical protein
MAGRRRRSERGAVFGPERSRGIRRFDEWRQGSGEYLSENKIFYFHCFLSEFSHDSEFPAPQIF